MSQRQRPNGTGRVRPHGARFKAYAPGRKGKHLGTYDTAKAAEEAIGHHVKLRRLLKFTRVPP